ncbi:Nitrogen assimilation transcription factor [Hortaea werneckii]|uniref:Zn(2)-C6 fungal-type domain-containing protein n=1 Tax=Hortaea werneckii TaxID=91943 RepID=A0A3M7BD75_HORWE|nr:Nitrogen assimilation transcription factor [Hortaea werneckii]KAI7676495.1 Nitrogen assimilation transcription factor [Hortaea werneckii]RMY21693.1 hypothetical protein D0867_03188 [Hortaea werneckii]RMY37587.1 hypothetical protein D0866_03165 [Hortaea werneckii]
MEPAIANKADQQIDARAPASSASGPSHISPFPHPTNATKPPKKPRSRRKAAVTEEEDDDDAKRRCVSTACVACRRRKSKCDGNQPACAACCQVYGTECVYDPNSDHRRKGVYRNDVESLKTKSETLHTLVQAILNYPEDAVAGLVQEIRTCQSLDAVAESIIARQNGEDALDAESEVQPAMPQTRFENTLYGKLGDLRLDDGSVRYIGGTSNLIHLTQDESNDVSDEYQQQEDPITSWTKVTDDPELVVHLLNMYFTWHYSYFTTLSKTLFYRDFLLGKPPATAKRKTFYCSSLLVNAMLALGCHFTSHSRAKENPEDSATAGDHFFREAKRLIMENDEHEKPRLTTVQALALMSVREAGCGREAKGWVYSGMSFRMACDMGLNLDSGRLTKNKAVSGDEEEEDVRRITFWGCYLFDKCWSNYLGRLPQLPTSVATVPKVEVFPDEDATTWCPYTDSGFTQAHVQPARTRAVALQITKLCEISNDLMKNFYNPTDMEKAKGKAAELKKLSDIHTRLESWRRELPREFEPKEGGLSSVLVMHMFFQLLFIHLFRPFLKYSQANSPLPQNEEIAEGWLAARRTLRILSVLARKWNVELPEEASTVLARTDAKFGPYIGEVGTPPAQRRDSQVSMNPSQFARAALQDPSSLPPATTFFNNPTIPAVAIPASSSGAPVHESSHNFQQPPLNAADLRAQQYPSATTSPGQGPANAFTNRQPTSTTSAGSPSDMFGGIEQLLRDSNDWVYKDQAQWATGFENWDVDPSTWTNGGFGSGDGPAMMNGMNGMPGMNQMPTNSAATDGATATSMQSTSPAYSATSAGAAAPPYLGADGSWLNGMNPGNLSAYDENAWYS